VFLSEDNGITWKLWSDVTGSGSFTINAISSNPCEYGFTEPGGAAFAIEPATPDPFPATGYPTTILATSQGLWTNPKGQRSTRPGGTAANGATAGTGVATQQVNEAIYWLEEAASDGTDYSGASGDGSPGATGKADCLAAVMQDVTFHASTHTFYAVGATGNIVASCSDGRGWHGHSMPIASATYNGVAANDNFPCTFTRTVAQTSGVNT
jgi:hypothetical protein